MGGLAERPAVWRTAKVRTIRAATNGRVGVLEGWGGMYMLDLIPAGICGLTTNRGPTSSRLPFRVSSA